MVVQNIGRLQVTVLRLHLLLSLVMAHGMQEVEEAEVDADIIPVLKLIHIGRVELEAPGAAEQEVVGV